MKFYRRNPPIEGYFFIIPVIAAAGAAYYFRNNIKALLGPKFEGKPVLKMSDSSLRTEKKASPAIRKAFTATIAKYAPSIEAKYGIMPEITVRQAALESSYGTSGLAMTGKNLYGIKASKAWLAAGKPVWTGLTEENTGGKFVLIKDTFKKYGSWPESIDDWAKLISGTYKTAYKYARTGDINSYAKALVAGGYTTHPQYPELLKSVII